MKNNLIFFIQDLKEILKLFENTVNLRDLPFSEKIYANLLYVKCMTNFLANRSMKVGWERELNLANANNRNAKKCKRIK